MTHNTHAYKALTVTLLKISWEPLLFPGCSLASPWTFFYTQWLQSIILCHTRVVQYKTSFVIRAEYRSVLTLLLMVPYFDFIFPGASIDFWLGFSGSGASWDGSEQTWEHLLTQRQHSIQSNELSDVWKGRHGLDVCLPQARTQVTVFPWRHTGTMYTSRIKTEALGACKTMMYARQWLILSVCLWLCVRNVSYIWATVLTWIEKQIYKERNREAHWLISSSRLTDNGESLAVRLHYIRLLWRRCLLHQTEWKRHIVRVRTDVVFIYGTAPHPAL